MKLFSNRILVVLAAMLLTSCIKDTGNYDYINGPDVVITYPTALNAMVDEPTHIQTVRKFADPTKDESDYNHEWYVSGELYSTDTMLIYTGSKPGSHPLRYSMIDKKTGIRTFAADINLTVTSPYQAGWGILYEKNGKSELAHIRASGETFVDYVDIYKEKHNGAELGSKPVKLKNYNVLGNWVTVVMQHGGQGTIEMDSHSMLQLLKLKDAFVGGTPANSNANNIGVYANAQLLLMEDGNVYARFFSNNIVPYSVPFMNLPLTIAKGMKVKEIWDTWSGRVLMSFMYDELNNRILYVNHSTPNATGGFANIDTLPAPPAATPYPADHVNFNNMGAWEYVWGGSMNEAPNTGSGIVCDGVVLMRSPTNQQIYLQSFNIRNVNRVVTFTPKLRKPFTGNDLVNSSSIYVGIKSRDFIFFSGGAENKNLYYFDMVTGAASTLYTTLPARITTMSQSDNGLQLAVGLEDGSVYLYDISNNVLIEGNSKELHKLTGLGKVVDITVKGGNMR